MKKNTLLFFIAVLSSLSALAQYNFTPIVGPTNVVNGADVSINLNDAVNSTAVTAGVYLDFTVTVDWAAGGGGPWSNEAELDFITSAGTVTFTTATTGSANDGNATALTFTGTMAGVYDTTGDTTLDIVLRQSYGGSDADWSNISVTINPAPACIDPSMLTATGITATTADLGWTTGGSGEASWDVEVVGTGIPATGTPTDSGVANPFNKTGLTAATTYDFYVRANCGGSGYSAWVGPFSFTTVCPTSFTPDYTNDFTAYPGNCWEEGNDTDIATGPNNTNGAWAGGDFLNTPGTNGARINLWNLGDSDWLVSPTFDLSAGGYELKIDVAVTDFLDPADDTMGSDDEVQVLISNDDGATWINLETFNATNEPVFTGETKTYDLTAYTSSTTKFAFWSTEGTVDDTEDYDFHVANFVVRTTPSCVEPTALTATGITATSVDLGWTTGGSGEATWDVEVVGTGIPATGMPTDGGVVNPFNKTGLTAATTYDFYVRANCGGGDSLWAGPFSFTTLCAAITPDYTNDFTVYPGNCWEEGNDTDIATGPNNTDGAWAGGDFLNTPGTNGARINLWNLGDSDWLVSPTFDLSAGSYGMAVDVAVTDFLDPADDTMGSDDEVQVLISNDDGATWINLETFNTANEPVFTGETKIYDLAAYTSSTTKFAFWSTEGTVDDTEDYDFHISNFRVDAYTVLGVEELQTLEGFKYFPNPANDNLTVQAQNNIEKLQIVSMLGQVVRSAHPNLQSYSLDISDLSSGIYFIKATVNNVEGTFRIVKQ